MKHHFNIWKRKCCPILFGLLLIMALSACRNADFIGNSYKVDDSITIEFQVLNSTKMNEINLNSGDTVRFDVTRASGQIDISFGIEDAVPVYEGKPLESGSFTVTVHEDGRYVLTVSGSDAKGSVRLTKE